MFDLYKVIITDVCKKVYKYNKFCPRCACEVKNDIVN